MKYIKRDENRWGIHEHGSVYRIMTEKELSDAKAQEALS